jgi:DNA repair protein RecN (Recombination protein N)
MLQELVIKNFAIIDELNICFHAGLNVVTGETGAGKTIIISALELVLGGKAHAEYIRAAEDKAVVEACFDISRLDSIKRLLSDYGIESSEDTLILKRQLSRGTRGGCYANGGLIPLNLMARLGRELIDIHGQHQHQLLLAPETHIDFLDAFGNLLDLRRQVEETYTAWQDKQNRLNQLLGENRQKEERRQLLEFQRQEIDGVQPKEDEQEALLKERTILQNAGSLLEAGDFVYETIYNADGSARDKLAEASARLKQMERIDASLAPFGESLESIQCQLEDMAFSLRSYIERIEHDPERQQEIEDRLEEIEKLERKYGGSLIQVLDYRQQIENELQNLEQLDEQINSLSRETVSLTHRLNNLSAALSSKRKQVSKRIDRLMSRQLEQLGMEKNRFSTRITPINSKQEENPTPQYNGNAKGIDQVEFLFSANVGEGVRPLARIASGGEISRLMLALKCLLAGKDRVSTLIFDEVDAGIGGRVAEIVGKKLKSLANEHQIICITHLPQIACFADHHYMVEKEISRGRTVALIKGLDHTARVAEIARMLAGEEITSTALKHAREMIDKGMG